MDVNAIIREVFEELSSKATIEAASWPADRLQPIRRRYLDPFFDGYNARPFGVQARRVEGLDPIPWNEP